MFVVGISRFDGLVCIFTEAYSRWEKSMRMSTIISTLLFAKILHKYTTNIQNRQYNFAVDESCNIYMQFLHYNCTTYINDR
jgi:hypothetical protein